MISSTIRNRHGERRYPRLVLDLRKKAFSILPSSTMLSVVSFLRFSLSGWASNCSFLRFFMRWTLLNNSYSSFMIITWVFFLFQLIWWFTPVELFIIALLRYNSHTIKVHHFQVYNSVVQPLPKSNSKTFSINWFWNVNPTLHSWEKFPLSWYIILFINWFNILIFS